MTDREEQEHIKRARYCDIAERYQDMALEMKKVLQICYETKQEITIPIRNLFSLAYKNLVSARRSSWRVLYSEKQKLEEKQSDELHIVDELLHRVENELSACCTEVLEIIDQYVLVDIESRPVSDRVFFLKMKGDYYRYKAEIQPSDDEKGPAKEALKYYLMAKEKANELNSTDPVRLGLDLNFSVFNYEILNNTEVACEIANAAFTAAITHLDTLSEDYYKDSALIMQLLRDNLTLWTSKNDLSQTKNEETNLELA
ncbi:hypothetical protein PAEPH01_0632 [Pancytospora epiphaga]|nr:hypothetical protein PAEPH01_0632 [Pancytospora epiphaga]